MSTVRSTTPSDDQNLIAAICREDESALETLYNTHIDRMLGLACRILNNKTDAEDVIHDVFIEVWKKAASYNPNRGSVVAWLMLRARSRSLDRVRMLNTARKHASKLDEDGRSEDLNGYQYDSSKRKKKVHEALSSLSDKQRNVIELSYFKGLSCSEISRYYDIPLGTVKTRLLAGVTKLRTYMMVLAVET